MQVTQPGQTAPTQVGQIQLATFLNEGGLSAEGNNLLMESAASGAATVGTPGASGIGQLLQGYTEASNVDAVGEITALIVAQRAYEMNSKVVTAAVSNMPAERSCKCGSALAHALITDRKTVPEITLKKLELLVGKYFQQ